MASVVVYSGVGQKGSLCLASDWPPQWRLLRLYQRRYPVEATFRDYKSHGRHWEGGLGEGLGTYGAIAGGDGVSDVASVARGDAGGE